MIALLLVETFMVVVVVTAAAAAAGGGGQNRQRTSGLVGWEGSTIPTSTTTTSLSFSRFNEQYYNL